MTQFYVLPVDDKCLIVDVGEESDKDHVIYSQIEVVNELKRIAERNQFTKQFCLDPFYFSKDVPNNVTIEPVAIVIATNNISIIGGSTISYITVKSPGGDKSIIMQHIHYFFIDESYQGAGQGQQMFDYMRHRIIYPATLLCDKLNHPAQNFWFRNGFQIVDETARDDSAYLLTYDGDF